MQLLQISRNQYQNDRGHEQGVTAKDVESMPCLNTHQFRSHNSLLGVHLHEPRRLPV
jgi:hypothetical protein